MICHFYHEFTIMVDARCGGTVLWWHETFNVERDRTGYHDVHGDLRCKQVTTNSKWPHDGEDLKRHAN